MNAIGALPVWAGGAAKAAGSRGARVEKTAESAELNGEYRGDPERRERRGPFTDRRAVSRHGTGGAAPLWYGPRLRAPFVAQIIGQVLPQGETPGTIAYREDAVPVALVFDKRA